MQGDIRIEDAYPLLPAQRGFLVDSLAGEEDRYRQQICVEVSLPAPVLKKNIQELVARNKILRTVFDWSDGEPLQVIIGGIRPSINILSVRKDGTLSMLLNQEKGALRPVSDSPPIRFAIILDDHRVLLAVTYHHILLDGPSINLLLEQVLTAKYLPEVPASVYQEWFEQNIGGNEYTAWRDLLSDVDKQSGMLHGNASPNATKQYQAKLGPAFYGKLLKKVKELHTTPAIYIQTLWSEWALIYFGKESLLYGLVMSTRAADLSDTAIGPYISTVPWLAHGKDNDFDRIVKTTNDDVLNVIKAKHIPLGDIAKRISPLVMRFDAILTITTRPVQSTTLYKVLETYENTGYKLSVDIEIADGVSISFSTPLNGMANALESFVSYAKRQINSSLKVPIYERHEGVPEPEGAETVNIENQSKLIAALANTFDISEKDIQQNSSFLELGGDSIVALRLKSLLKNKGFDVTIGDILQTTSIQELAAKMKTHKPAVSVPDGSASESIIVAKDLLGDIVEDITFIPAAARMIVDAYRLGFGQDYHEQTAFRLAGSFDALKLASALDKLAWEHPTLRLVYPSELPDIQVLTSVPRVSLEAKKPTTQSFDQFVRYISQEHWESPFDITKGPLLRTVVVGDVGEDEWYFFMSFSALVTDGWSFSAMLERLFSIYRELLVDSYAPRSADPYIEYSKSLYGSSKDQSYTSVTIDSYSSEIVSKDFVIDSALAAKIFNKSRKSHRTVNDILLSSLRKALLGKGFAEIKVYENGRDDPRLFTSVGPYCFLSSKKLEKHGKKQAYYVFESYPRDSENRLKGGLVEYFDENGNWRRDLLPPAVDIGFVFDVDKDIINVRVLVRDNQKVHNINTYWKALLAVMRGM